MFEFAESLKMQSLAVLGLALLMAVPARAEYQPGRVPEGSNAFTLPRHDLRLAVLGRSGFGFTDRTELTTYLTLFGVLLPNFEIKHRYYDEGAFAAAWSMDLLGGLYLVPIAGAIPLPGGAAGAAGVGAVPIGSEAANLFFTYRASYRLALSGKGGLRAVEAKAILVAAGGAVGGGNSGATLLATSVSGSRLIETGGLEVSGTLGGHDAFLAGLDGWFFNSWNSSHDDGLIFPCLAWTHAWTHTHFAGGAYTLVDLPHMRALHSRLPVAPYLNLFWTW